MRKLNWKTAARVIFSAGLLVWLTFLIDWKQMIRIWSQVQIIWILAAIAWIILSMIISVQKWQMVLKAQDINLSWTELWKAYWAGIFFNNFLPSSIGGDALRIWWVGKCTRDNPGAATSVIIERILATIGLAVTGLIGAALVDRADERVIALFVVLILVSFTLLGIISWRGFSQWAAKRPGRVITFLKNMVGHGIKFRRQSGRLFIVIILSVAFQTAVVGVNYSIFRSLHVSTLAAGDLLYVIPAISVAAMLPLGINGYGLREGAYIVMLASYQISPGVAVSASLLFVFLVSLCSLYGAYTWHKQQLKGDMTDVEFREITNS